MTTRLKVSVRDLERADLASVYGILEDSSLFPPAMLAPMAEPYLSQQAPHQWLVASAEGRLIAFAYAEPERMTDGTYNLLAIAVVQAFQGRGVGKALVKTLEDQLRSRGGRILVVETSSTPAYAGARTFYARQSFCEEARIRDFYTEGEDKIVFWKHL